MSSDHRTAPETAVVLVHGLGSSSRAWTPQLRGLRDRYRVLAPDLPGHGEADGPFTLPRAVASVLASLDESGGPAHLVGISGGATVAVLTCLEAPTRVASLVLSGGVVHAPRMLPVQRALTRITPPGLLARSLQSVLSGGSHGHARAAAEDLRRCGKSTFLAALREIARLDLRDRLDEIAVPTLVVCGTRDQPNLGPSREIAAGIRGAELRVIPDANHLWNLQQPDLFNETLTRFLDGACGPPGPGISTRVAPV